MVRVLILNGDTVQQTIDLDKKFLFILVKDGKRKECFHLDSTDGNMWKAKPDLSNLNLGKFKHGHDWIVKENFKQMKETK